MTHTQAARVLALLMAQYIATACGETPTVAPTHPPPSAALALSTMTSCGASFRMVVTDVDSLLAPYGITQSVDTVDVCETWTGSDYQYQALAVGSSDNLPDLDAVQSITYDGAGNVAGYDASGSESAPTDAVGPTAFDFLYADDATKQASYDDPYYGVASPDPSASTCLEEPCPAMSVSATVADTLRRFARHGITRRGVRALVDDAEEISRSSEGYRRFRAVLPTETVIRSVDPKTQLLMAEVRAGPADTIVTRYTWKKVQGGYLRASSESESVEFIAGRKIQNRTKVVFQRVRVTDPKFPLLIDPEASQ